MTNHQHFLVDLDESSHEQERHIKISYKSLAWILGSVLVLALIAAGAFTSYLQMFWKAQTYDKLRSDFDHLRGRYQVLEKDKQKSAQQMDTLENLAQTVSVAYGINPQADVAMDEDDSSATSMKESIQEFNILKAASFSHIFHHYAHQFQSHNQPSLWPVAGLVRSSFGSRTDPFSGEAGHFHTAIDLSAAIGTAVHVAADGVVQFVGPNGRYGRLVVVDHGGGYQTYYGHLSQYMVVVGQEVRRSEVIALSGNTGRATGPHLHYEVRVHGTPVNPYRYLGLNGTQVASSSKPRSDLGL